MNFLKGLFVVPKIEETQFSKEIRQLLKEASSAKINIRELDGLIEATYIRFDNKDMEVNHESVVAF